MPCRDYMDDLQHSRSMGAEVAELKARCDMLSRIACKALTHIEETNDGLEVLILADPEIQNWWTAHKEADRKAQAAAAKKAAALAERDRLARIREETLAQLTPDQIKALRIK